MFFSSYPNNQDPYQLADYLYPVQNSRSEKISHNYTIYSPYQLAFFTLRFEEDEDYEIVETLAPAGALYSKITGDNFQKSISQANMHKHDFFELMYVISGEVYVNIENQRHLYTKDCCCLLNKNVLHTEEFQTQAQFVFLQISTALFESVYKDLTLDFFAEDSNSKDSELIEFMKVNLADSIYSGKSYLDFVPVNPSDHHLQMLHRQFDLLTMETLDPAAGSSFRIKSAIVQLFELLSDQTLFSSIPMQLGTDKEFELFGKISELMQKNCGRISRSQLSEQLNYSGAYLNEIVKKYSGLSIFDFGMTFCMKEAAHLLSSSKENISDISSYLGFSNRSHFYKVFQSTYHMTPAEYRRMQKMQ